MGLKSARPRLWIWEENLPGPLFEGNPVGEGTTRRGTASPVHRPQRPAGSTHSSTRGLRPPEQLAREGTTASRRLEEGLSRSLSLPCVFSTGDSAKHLVGTREVTGLDSCRGHPGWSHFPVETVTQPSKVTQLVSAESESEPGPPTVDSGQTKSRRQYL